MSSLSATYNLSDPPSTIQVDTASMDPKPFVPSELKPTPSTTSAPDIDRVIQGFQHELDTLSRSFDLLASSHTKRPRPQHDDSYRFQSTLTPEPHEAPPPPLPTARSDADESLRLNLSRAEDTVFTQTTNKTPRPVETPVPNSSSRRPKYTAMPQHDHNLFPSASETNDTIQNLRELVSEQNATILKLKRECNDLRRQLLEAQHPRETTREPMLESSNRKDNYPTSYTRSRYSESHGRNHYDTTTPRSEKPNYYGTTRSNHNNNNSNYYYEDEMKPTISSLTSFPREEDDENTLESNTFPQSRHRHSPGARGFTPGTKFVAELSKFMTLHQGHSVPLSVIIDRHWDKLKYHMRDETGAGL